MIAHKRFKAISAVVLAALVAVGSAVPCFASDLLPTDDSGNWAPDRFYAYWLIYNTDSQSYETVNVSSSVTEDGLDFVFPYNTTGVTRVSLVLATDRYNATSNYYIDGLGLSGFAYYTNDRGTSGLVSLPSWLIVRPYYYNGSSLSALTTYNLNSNPFSLNVVYDSPSPFVGFWLTFECSLVSGTLSVHFDYISVNGEDISSKITVQNLDNAGDDLLDLADQLAVPTPNIDVESVVENALEGADMESVGEAWSFMSNDLITKMLLIVVSFALLGYILYGKKEAGGK